jgi:iron complex outermembrane receptor protein
VNYALPVPETLGIMNVGLAYSYTSKTFLSALTPYGTLPSYGLLNLSFNWRSILGSPVDMEFFATNLANKLYYTNGTSFYDNYGFEDHYLGEPRMYGVRVRLRFGK